MQGGKRPTSCYIESQWFRNTNDTMILPPIEFSNQNWYSNNPHTSTGKQISSKFLQAVLDVHDAVFIKGNREKISTWQNLAQW